MKNLLLIIIILTASTGSLFAATPKIDKLPSHPRLMVKSSDVEMLGTRFLHSDFDAVRAAYKEQIRFKTNGISPDGTPNEQTRQAMEALAFDYLIHGIVARRSGMKAIDIAIKYLPSLKKTTDYWGNTYIYDAIFGAALVYDWCYDLMSNEQKATLLAAMKQACSLTEYSPGVKLSNNYFSGHYGEMGPTIFLAIGIATFDEDREYFDFAYAEQIEKFAPSRNPMYASGAHHQGTQYMHVRFFSEILQSYILDCVGLNCYLPSISSLAYRGIYQTIAQQGDMDGMPEGDTHNNVRMGYHQCYYLSAMLSGDPFLQRISRKYINAHLSQSTRMFLYHDPTIASSELDGLPLSRLFPSPSGIMIARTGWDIDSVGYGSRAMVVQMNMKEYNSRNHDHSDAGHFSIYYRGHMALDAGIYQGRDPENGWGKTNFLNYYTRTVAHNSILVLDPNEPLPYGGSKKQAQARDGGQFTLKNDAWLTSSEMFSQGRIAHIMAHEIAPGNQPDYTYLKGDMTRAYVVPQYISTTYPAKVDTVRRSFVFLNNKSGIVPGTLIVLDKVVSTNPSFRKSWLLHTQNEPIIDGNTITSESRQDGRNGRMITTTLLPEPNNTLYTKIGGAGKEYFVDGRNWGTVNQQDAGEWRVELSPRTEALSDNFLNVIQVTDAEPAPAPFQAHKAVSRCGNYIAVEVGDRIVVQSLRLEDAAQGDIEFSIGSSGKQYKILVTDLTPGRREIQSASGKVIADVTASAGTLYFESSGGEFSIRKKLF